MNAISPAKPPERLDLEDFDVQTARARHYLEQGHYYAAIGSLRGAIVLLENAAKRQEDDGES